LQHSSKPITGGGKRLRGSYCKGKKVEKSKNILNYYWLKAMARIRGGFQKEWCIVPSIKICITRNPIAAPHSQVLARRCILDERSYENLFLELIC
jgi:hypothetical protein